MLSKELNTFIVTSECGSFNKASELLFISATAVMKQINILENELGFILFYRSSRGVRLTEAGRMFYESVKRIEGDYDNAVRTAREKSQSMTSVIRVGHSVLRPSTALFELWEQCEDIFPCFNMEIVPFSDDASNLERVFRTFGEDFDILVGVCDVTNWTRYFHFLEVREEPFCVAVPLSNPLSHKDRIELKDLCGEKMMIIGTGTSLLIDNIRRTLNEKYSEIEILSSPPHYDVQLFNMCSASNILLLTVSCWHDLHPGMKTIPVEWDFTMPYGIMKSHSTGIVFMPG